MTEESCGGAGRGGRAWAGAGVDGAGGGREVRCGRVRGPRLGDDLGGPLREGLRGLVRGVRGEGVRQELLRTGGRTGPSGRVRIGTTFRGGRRGCWEQGRRRGRRAAARLDGGEDEGLAGAEGGGGDAALLGRLRGGARERGRGGRDALSVRSFCCVVSHERWSGRGRRQRHTERGFARHAREPGRGARGEEPTGRRARLVGHVREEDRDDGLRGQLEVVDEVAHELRAGVWGRGGRGWGLREGDRSRQAERRRECWEERPGVVAAGGPGARGCEGRAFTASASITLRFEALRSAKESASGSKKITPGGTPEELITSLNAVHVE